MTMYVEGLVRGCVHAEGHVRGVYEEWVFDGCSKQCSRRIFFYC
jgi:hypothetical protein